MLVCTKNTIPRCIPEIYNVVNAVSCNGFETIILIMEKLDIDLCYFFDRKHNFEEEISMIALVAYNVYNLQKCMKNFMHRVFHSKNIMLKKLNDVQLTTIITEDVEFGVYNKINNEMSKLNRQEQMMSFQNQFIIPPKEELDGKNECKEY
jgi:hypothetical protein